MEKPDFQYDYSYKVIIVGESGVGKSCLLIRYTDDEFSNTYISTIGVDFKHKLVKKKNGDRVRLQIWDTAGQERFRTITRSFYRGAKTIILCFDLTNRHSFSKVSEWITSINDINFDACVLLVGTKCDLTKERMIEKDEAHALASKYGIDYIETSSKKNIGINELFSNIAENSKIIHSHKTPPKQQSNCCF
jgi:small GTP-binding protein